MILSETKEAILLKRIEASAAGSCCSLRIGDLDGDGRLDFVLIQPDSGFDERYFPHSVLSATAYTPDGDILWQIGKPSYDTKPCKSDIPAQIYDIDRDGNNEFLCVTDGSFCIFDGKTGELKRRCPLPGKYAHDCFSIADLEGVGYPRNIIIKNRYHQLWALDQNFNVLWTFKGNIGHYPLVYDINGDGKDEIIAGKFVLNSCGEVLMQFDTVDFPSCIYVGDLNMSKEASILIGGNKTIVYTPDGTIKWELNTSASTASLVAGNIRTDCFGQEIAGFFTENEKSDYTNGLFLVDYHGNSLFKEKRNDYINNTDVSSIYNFDGSNSDMISVVTDENIKIYDGYMNPVFLIPKTGDIYSADIIADGRYQIILYDGQNIEIYSSEEYELGKPAAASPRPQSRELYNYTSYKYRTENRSHFALGYAIGQFSSPDIYSWAEQCAGFTDEDDKIMSRADFCVVIASVLGLKGYVDEIFFDISKDDYFYPAVSALKCLGYIDDIVGKFSPSAPLTAGFATACIQQAAGFIPLTTKSDDDTLTIRDTAKLILQIYQKQNNV